MRGLVAIVLLSACGFPALPKLGASDAQVGDGNGGDGNGSDSDGSTINADAQQCFGSGAYTVCLATLPTLATTISDNAIIDTATSSSCLQNQPTGWINAGQPAACFVVGTNVNVANVRVFGSRPLVLVATNQVSITGLVDAASHLTASGIGPGAPYSACGAFLQQVIDNSAGGASGGAGASFMTRGGNGGFGNGSTGEPGGVSALAEATAPTKLRAGCAGQNGGFGSTNPSPGGGGYGGGAIYVVAGSTITLGASAIINVSGSGGGGASARGAGGGGGSGGMIVLYAPTINAAGKLVANGGAGGTGAAGTSITQPSGSDPDPTSPATPAPGIAGISGTGIGGSGYATAAAAQNGVGGAAGFGGGGGGAGAGYIQSNVTIGGVTASPTVTVVP